MLGGEDDTNSSSQFSRLLFDVDISPFSPKPGRWPSIASSHCLRALPWPDNIVVQALQSSAEPRRLAESVWWPGLLGLTPPHEKITLTSVCLTQARSAESMLIEHRECCVAWTTIPLISLTPVGHAAHKSQVSDSQGLFPISMTLFPPP